MRHLITRVHQQIRLFGGVAMSLLAQSVWADTPVINVDFGPSPGTHGAVTGQGPLGGGTFWNLAAGSKADLDDSLGNPTTVDVVLTNGSADERFAVASNELQDDSLTDASTVSFVIGGLDSSKTYSLAFFAHATFGHRVTVNGQLAVGIRSGLRMLGNTLADMEEGTDFQVIGEFPPKSGSNTIDVTVTQDGGSGTCFLAGFQIAEDFSKADGLIGPTVGRLGGDDLYLRRGSGQQKLRQVLNRPRTVRNSIKVQNDGLKSENINIRQQSTSRVRRTQFQVKYFNLSAERANITAAVLRGTFSPLLVARNGNQSLILQQIKPKRRALSRRPRIKARIDVECDPDSNDSLEDEDNLRSIVIVKRR